MSLNIGISQKSRLRWNDLNEEGRRERLGINDSYVDLPVSDSMVVPVVSA